MKHCLVLAVHLLVVAPVMGQQGSEKPVAARVAERKARSIFTGSAPFTEAEVPALRAALVGPVLTDATFMMASPEALAAVVAQQPEELTLTVPTGDGPIELDLVRAEIYSEGFSLVTASTNAAAGHTAGVHYRGIIAGQPYTLAAISIFSDEVMGTVSNAAGNHVLGKVEGSATEHIYYAERDLIDPPTFQCLTADDEGDIPERRANGQGDAKTVRCVDLYWEVNHNIFLDKGGLTNTSNYITGLFNQHAALFDNDGISVMLSELYIWDVPSPYIDWGIFTQFLEYRDSFNGDLANLITAGGAGAALGFAGLCASNVDSSMCYSGIYSWYNTLPTYSQSVKVIAHEEGHLLGSRHTHACVWNGNNTAIDGCSSVEGTCPQLPLPPAGSGTIMSYCQNQSSVGVNFINGFGPQPSALIVDNVNAASCVNACGTAGCGIPSDVSSAPLANSATLTWSAVSGAASYTLQWSVSTTGPWQTVAGISANNYTLLGLLPGATYLFRVRTECAEGSSAYCPIRLFTIPCMFGAPCDDGIPQTEDDVIVGNCICTGTMPPGFYQQINKVVASDRAKNDLFGQSVAISGDYAVVGAPWEDHTAFGAGFASMAGSAYVFVRNGNSWTQQQKIVASDRAAGDNFGMSVAISGDFIIVGAHTEDHDAAGGNSAPDAGSAYIYRLSGNTWVQQQKIVASDRAAGDHFGISVAINGDHAIVGAYLEDEDPAGGNTANNAGSAYIFVRNGNSWTQHQKIVASDRAGSDNFGISVAISGDFAIIGADSDDAVPMGGGSGFNSGSAYIFHQSGSTWAQHQKVVAPDPSFNASFGYSVAMNGDRAIVGAPNEQQDETGENAINEAGAAYVFGLNGSTWALEQKIVASDRGLADHFGFSVAISGDHAIVGAYYENEDAAGGNLISNSGSAYLFVRSDSTWSQLQKIIAGDRADNDRFGVSVGISGDHAIAGAYQEDEDVFGNNTLNDAGSAYFFQLVSPLPTNIAEAYGGDGFTIFPNPSPGPFTAAITLDEPALVILELFDAMGRCVHRFDARPYAAGSHQITLQLEQLRNGVYQLRMTMEGKQVSRRLVKL